MQDSVSQVQATPANKVKRWSWTKKKPQVPHAGIQTEVVAQPANFYERAIEWTHRADKVINLVLGYLLAIASVLGFMDVLSNGQVLGQVPYLFYVWLAIMGLGVDFQILLVIGRVPDLFRVPAAGWQKWLIFTFNGFFLLFLAVMSIATGAIFTQHRDMPTTVLTILSHGKAQVVTHDSTIGEAMDVLGINSILYVYGRAALATLLLVLMAVDRTMERWRMQLTAAPRNLQMQFTAGSDADQQVSVQPEAMQVHDLDKVLQAVVTMNQQNLQQMQEMSRQTVAQVSQITVEVVNETINRLAASISLPDTRGNVRQLPEANQGEHTVVQSESEAGDTGTFLPDEKHVRREQSMPFTKNYGSAIEHLLQAEPHLTDREIAERVGCGVGTANKWKLRIQQPAQ